MTYFALGQITDAPDRSLEADVTSHHLVCISVTRGCVAVKLDRA